MEKRNQVTPLGWVAVIALMTFVALLVGSGVAVYTDSLRGFELGSLAMFGVMLLGVIATIVVPPPDPETTKLKPDPTPAELKRRLRVRGGAAWGAGLVLYVVLLAAGAPYHVAMDAGTVVGLAGIGSFFFGLMRAARAKQAVEALGRN